MTEVRKESVTYLEIDAASEGQRLDNFLIKICKGVPKSHLYRIVRSGEVRVNGKRCAVDTRLVIADRIRVPPLRVPERPAEIARQSERGQALKLDFPVLLEDDAVLAINKPAGIAVHGGSGVAFGVIEALRHQRPDAPFVELAHRLDRETSGVLLLGKRRSALRKLHEMFRHGDIDKRYLVLVRGRWPEAESHVRLPLAKHNDENGEKRVRVETDGQEAYSIFRRLAATEEASLLEAQIKTGRTHQIRVHLSHLGYPVLGDERYGDFELNRNLARRGLRRMFLHAWRNAFVHPVTSERIRLEAGLPEELSRYLMSVSGMQEALRGKKF